jgi:predicted 3-demethylubiquinone-9 3-methyltransferase (glyoxalase superfamily)
MQNIIPSLWFDKNAEDAVNFYISIFKNSKMERVARYGEAGPGPAGTVMTIEFSLNGEKFLAINGGPYFSFTPAISFMAPCETQEEIDRLWSQLSEGGTTEQCGWLKDKYGVSWQIVPSILADMLQDEDTEKAQRVMKPMLQMNKLDMQALRSAYEQGFTS